MPDPETSGRTSDVVARDRPERVRLRTPHLTLATGFAIGMAGLAAAVAAVSSTTTGRVLALAAIPAMLIAALDTAIPRRFRLTAQGVTFRGSFRWRTWRWDEIAHASVHTSTWFGRPTSAVLLTLHSGRSVLLDEAWTWHPRGQHTGTAAMAVAILNSALTDRRYRDSLSG